MSSPLHTRRVDLECSDLNSFQVEIVSRNWLLPRNRGDALRSTPRSPLEKTQRLARASESAVRCPAKERRARTSKAETDSSTGSLRRKTASRTPLALENGFAYQEDNAAMANFADAQRPALRVKRKPKMACFDSLTSSRFCHVCSRNPNKPAPCGMRPNHPRPMPQGRVPAGLRQEQVRRF